MECIGPGATSPGGRKDSAVPAETESPAPPPRPPPPAGTVERGRPRVVDGGVRSDHPPLEPVPTLRCGDPLQGACGTGSVQVVQPERRHHLRRFGATSCMEKQPPCQLWRCESRGLCAEIGQCHDWVIDIVMQRYQDGSGDLPGEDHRTGIPAPSSSSRTRVLPGGGRRERPSRPERLRPVRQPRTPRKAAPGQ